MSVPETAAERNEQMKIDTQHIPLIALGGSAVALDDLFHLLWRIQTQFLGSLPPPQSGNACFFFNDRPGPLVCNDRLAYHWMVRRHNPSQMPLGRYPWLQDGRKALANHQDQYLKVYLLWEVAATAGLLWSSADDRPALVCLPCRSIFTG